MSKKRVSSVQWELIIEHLERHQQLARGYNNTSRGRELASRLWGELATRLNTEGLGVSKTPQEWATYINNFKSKLKSKVADFNKKSNGTREGPSDSVEFTELELRLLALLGLGVGQRVPNVRVNPIFNMDESQASKPKRFKSSHFSQVKKACVELVKVHGRPISLFDDAAFKDLINCIPLTNKEKQTITSDYIQTLIDNEEEAADDSTDMDVTADQTFDDEQDDDDEVPLKQIVKGEVMICNCAKDSDDTVEKHDPTCPAAGVPQQTYWNFFEVSMDEAKCNICNKTISWSTITKLKEHLQTQHPDVEFLDDDEDFQKGPPSSVGSREDMEEIYLDDNPFQDSAKSSKRRKKAKQALLGDKPVTRENIANSLHRFKSLDNFGTYVASLMKLIPKDKCIKFQIQIVERLLQEQAAAA